VSGVLSDESDGIPGGGTRFLLTAKIIIIKDRKKIGTWCKGGDWGLQFSSSLD
jgi:hypothetical protein